MKERPILFNTDMVAGGGMSNSKFSEFNKSIPPTVFWHSPTEVPPVEMFDLDLFWIAIQSQYSPEQEPKISVYLAHYINKPLTLDENDDPLDPDPHIDPDGDYVGAVGWHCEYDHPDFSRFFQPITFNDQHKLLGWAEYVPPVWNGEVSA